MAREAYVLRPDREPTLLRLWTLSRAEFDWWRAEIGRHKLALRCTNERCNADMHLKRSAVGSQFAAHNPGTGDDKCPNRQGESAEHEELKLIIAGQFEAFDMRTSVETFLGARKPDVCVFRKDQRSGDAPVFACEIQRSPLSVGTLTARTADLRPMLDMTDRRAAPVWFPTYRPGNADTFGHLQLDEDTMQIVGGLTLRADGDVNVIAPLETVIEGIARHDVRYLDDGRNSWWSHFGTSGRKVRQPGAKAARHQRPGSRSDPCLRGGVEAAYMRCHVCGGQELHYEVDGQWECVACRDRAASPMATQTAWHFEIMPSKPKRPANEQPAAERPEVVKRRPDTGVVDTTWLTKLAGPPTNTAPSRQPNITARDVDAIRASDAYRRGAERAAGSVPGASR